MSQPLPLVLVTEDGDEYTARLSRLLGHSFRFTRAASFSDAEAALRAPPSTAEPEVSVLLLDLDFRRTPLAHLIDERGLPAPASHAARLAAVQGILILRALRKLGLTTPALLCADLDDPDQERHLAAELAPLQVSPSSEGLPQIAARLRALGA
jgi:hypothetical protein